MKRAVFISIFIIIALVCAFFAYRYFKTDDKTLVYNFIREFVPHVEKLSEKGLVSEQSDLAFLRSRLAGNVEASIVPYARNLPSERGTLLAGFSMARRNMSTLTLDLIFRDAALDYDQQGKLVRAKIFFTANLNAEFKGQATTMADTFDCEAAINRNADGDFEIRAFSAHTVIHK